MNHSGVPRSPFRTNSLLIPCTKTWLAAAAAVLWAGSAFATPFTFTFSGTSPTDGRAQNASAVFTTTSNSLTLVLSNTGGAGQIGGITSVLDGIAFTFSSTPTSVALTGASSANGTITCTSSGCGAPTGLTTDDTTFFGWTVSNTLSNPLLAAGGGSYKPYGIVNGNVTNTDGISNAQHNPYLDGPVTFTLSLGGLTDAPSITGVDFYFGTGPDIQTGVNRSFEGPNPVPEPGGMVLLGTGVLLLALALRARRLPAWQVR
jgi:hypothetical protein